LGGGALMLIQVGQGGGPRTAKINRAKNSRGTHVRQMTSTERRENMSQLTEGTGGWGGKRGGGNSRKTPLLESVGRLVTPVRERTGQEKKKKNESQTQGVTPVPHARKAGRTGREKKTGEIWGKGKQTKSHLQGGIGKAYRDQGARPSATFEETRRKGGVESQGVKPSKKSADPEWEK